MKSHLSCFVRFWRKADPPHFITFEWRTSLQRKGKAAGMLQP
jgi:hypothetical protein